MGHSKAACSFKWILRVSVVLFGLMIISDQAYAASTSNPNHKGWSGKTPRLEKVKWKPIKTKCKHCVKLTEQYNATVKALLLNRLGVKNQQDKLKEKRENLRILHELKDISKQRDSPISSKETRGIAATLEELEYHRAALALNQKAVAALEQHADYLSRAVSTCERTACKIKKPPKKKKIKIGGEYPKEPFRPDVAGILKQHDINWQGKYRTNCTSCVTYAKQLNAVPGWVVAKHLELQRLELALQQVKKLHIFYKFDPDRPAFELKEAENGVEKVKSEIKQIKILFESLLQEFADCLAKYCSKLKDPDNAILIGEPISQCPKPAATEAITVGANNDVGSKANFREKARKKVAGLATKAITGLLGIGGGGGKSNEPVTYKDPVKKKVKIKHKAEKRQIRVGGVFTEDGLLISTNIKKAPGKGTFQSVHLQTPSGWQLVPIRLFLYEIWQSWKLSVSWTRDTYVDGELVKHEEGGWTEGWKVLVAKGKRVDYVEVPIWEQLGFNTAVSGARSLGTLFPVSPAMLASEPINLVIHVTDPKKDPVITFPYVFQVSLNSKGKVIIEQVDQTMAATGNPCKEPVIVISDSKTEETPSSTPDEKTPASMSAPNANTPQHCPNNWVCTDGKSCPPIDNCTIAITDTPDGSPNNQPDDDASDDIEEIEVTGSRRGGSTPAEPGPIDTSIDEIEELDVTGTHSSGTTTENYGTESYGGSSLDYGLNANSGLDYDLEKSTTYDLEEIPTLTITEEEEEPPVVGILLQNFGSNWIPTASNYTSLTAKMYVPHPTRTNTWIPHPSVQRKMTIRFIARSNERGKAMNAMLIRAPEDAPDLYFDQQRNFLVECSDDPTGRGHFGTCTTKFTENEKHFAINSQDFGGFSRLDVSCDGCVALKALAEMPAGAAQNAIWPLAVEEQNQERRAVYVPRDDNRNQISDGYLPDRTDSPSATQDTESAPVGNGVAGDGLSAYEEYRGFYDKGSRHHRTDWNKKTVLIVNGQSISTGQFERASGLEVLDIDYWHHRERVINFNSGHANVVDQHGLKLRLKPDLEEDTAGRCFCQIGGGRPKTSRLVAIKPGSEATPTVAHELGHAVGMQHHGDTRWPEEKETIKPASNSVGSLFGRVHSNVSLCGKALPHNFWIGTKGDQGSGHESCIMRYEHIHYAYEQDAGDYDCMPAKNRTLFDSNSDGTGPNGFDRTASDASRGDCMSQIWISS